MDIVKERKRRLFAYLMVIVLGLYMHPTSSLKAAEANITITANFDSDTIVPEGWIETNAPEGWSSAEGTQWYSKNYAAGDKVTATGILTVETETRTHYVVEWMDLNNSGNQGVNEFLIPDNVLEGTSYLLSARWGSYIKLMYGTHVICETSEQKLDGSDTLTLNFPILSDTEICKYGKFFDNKWKVTGNEVVLELDENTTTMKISDFYELMNANMELIVDVVPEASNYTNTTIPDTGGSFALEQGIAYTLGTSEDTWMIGNDGYTYAGGVTFYVPENNTYDFLKK